MSQNIIGLDIGSYSIKLVEVLRDFRDFRFVKGFEARIPLDPKVSREEAIQLILEEQFQQENFSKKQSSAHFQEPKYLHVYFPYLLKIEEKLKKWFRTKLRVKFQWIWIPFIMIGIFFRRLITILQLPQKEQPYLPFPL